MKKNEIKKILFIFFIGIVFATFTEVSAQTAPSRKVYASTLPDTVVRKTTGTVGFLNQGTTPVVRDWYSDDGYELYCSDRTNEATGDDTLTKDARMDYGIAYLLMNAYPNVNLIQNVFAYLSTDSGTNSDSGSTYKANVFITQYALWGYQGTVDSSSLSTKQLGYTITNDVTDSYYMYYNSKDTANLLTEKNLWQKANITNLINNAKTANSKDPAASTLSVNAGDDWSKTDDGYKSGLITVAPSSSEAKYSTYSVTLKDAPEGVKVFNEAGTDVTNSLTNITAGTKIYVLVPTDKAKSGPKFTVEAKTNISYNSAYKYVDKVNNHQPSVLVGPDSKEISGSLELTIIPDTASSISSSMYFVGFIILLCGAGIIYANVKPTKQTN